MFNNANNLVKRVILVIFLIEINETFILTFPQITFYFACYWEGILHHSPNVKTYSPFLLSKNMVDYVCFGILLRCKFDLNRGSWFEFSRLYICLFCVIIIVFLVPLCKWQILSSKTFSTWKVSDVINLYSHLFLDMVNLLIYRGPSPKCTLK